MREIVKIMYESSYSERGIISRYGLKFKSMAIASVILDWEKKQGTLRLVVACPIESSRRKLRAQAVVDKAPIPTLFSILGRYLRI